MKCRIYQETLAHLHLKKYDTISYLHLPIAVNHNSEYYRCQEENSKIEKRAKVKEGPLCGIECRHHEFWVVLCSQQYKDLQSGLSVVIKSPAIWEYKVTTPMEFGTPVELTKKSEINHCKATSHTRYISPHNSCKTHFGGHN